MVMSVVTWRTKAAAVGIALLALLYTAQLRAVADVAAYLSLLMVVAVLVALFAAARLWNAGTFDGRALAAALCLVALVGQLLNSTIGLPGANDLRGVLTLELALGVGLEAGVLVLLTVDVFRRPPKPDRARPYAL